MTARFSPKARATLATSAILFLALLWVLPFLWFFIRQSLQSFRYDLEAYHNSVTGLLGHYVRAWFTFDGWLWQLQGPESNKIFRPSNTAPYSHTTPKVAITVANSR